LTPHRTEAIPTDTAEGDDALFSLTTGSYNTAIGGGALYGNTTGSFNTATGGGRIQPNGYNTGTLYNNTSGSQNTATGCQALSRNQTGNGNTAEGFQALAKNIGSFNVAVGFTAGANLTTGNDNIDIGHPGVAGESGTLRIGTGKTIAAYIKGIYGRTVASGVGVIVGSDGHLGTVQSSARFKEAIKPMDKVSEAILSLEPVTFRYRQDLDPNGIPQFGLIAEEVDKVNPDLVVRGEDGKVMSVRYEAVNAMLLNEFLKERQKVQRLEATAEKQQKQIEALTATVRKVSERVELSAPAPQIAANEN
jgi:hypothetical protein